MGAWHWKREWKNWECWDFVCLNKINLIPDLLKLLLSSLLFAWLQTAELPTQTRHLYHVHAITLLAAEQDQRRETCHKKDNSRADHALQVGDHVYVRNRVLGRNKIQDFKRPELQRGKSRPFDDQHVYMIQRLAGGDERAMHRKDLMPATLCWSWTLITTTSLHLKMTVTPSQTVTTNCVLY